MIISVLIPFYNEADSAPTAIDCLREMIESLRSDVEIILVDDGSRDGTLAVLNRACEDDDRFTSRFLYDDYLSEILAEARPSRL